MEKKEYLLPLVEVMLLDTEELMQASGTSPDLPPPPVVSRRAWTEVF